SSDVCSSDLEVAGYAIGDLRTTPENERCRRVADVVLGCELGHLEILRHVERKETGVGVNRAGSCLPRLERVVVVARRIEEDDDDAVGTQLHVERGEPRPLHEEGRGFPRPSKTTGKPC